MELLPSLSQTVHANEMGVITATKKVKMILQHYYRHDMDKM